MREIVLDTETTGLDPGDGHRIVEIGCIELFNHVPTGRSFHRYINPERSMPSDAQAVHGLTDEFLSDKPLFAAVVDEFLEFVGNDCLVIHNAEFDLRFLNYELKRLGRPALACGHADTLSLARKKFPGAPASLDALCKRFDIDLSDREKHGALIDCRLLADVYLELIGGRQPTLAIVADIARDVASSIVVDRPWREPRAHAPTEDELAAHAAMLARLKQPLWLAAD
ncbi:MAG TPA: DNA polymerase III subunit epsilon [Thermoanaerobaculia bacterium]|nr:DNA polymerase III subunit epsilon [Thermoanaerobaculia bacterium]